MGRKEKSMNRNSFKRKMAWLLTLSMVLTMAPSVSMAQETVGIEEGTPITGTSSSTLKAVVEKYVDAQDGKEIADASTYSVAYEEKDPQKIKGYTYVDYSETVEQVYSHKDIPYIIGYPEGDVRTARNLSRAEAATIFYRLYDGEYPEFTQRMSNNTFADVKTKNWFYKEVETMYNIGIIEGDGKNFRPNDPITRAELAVIAARFTDLKYATGEVFSDVPRGHWAYSYIVAATKKGWLRGYGDGTFRPDNNISRLETMTLINRVVNRSVTREKLRELGVKNPYWDIVENYWGYPEVMEATIRHNGAEWHGIEYNGGEYDVIVEKFVDTHGNEIAKSVTSKGKAEKDAKEIPAYDHLGYIRTITYVYSNGTAAPSIKKEADKKESYVGDTITYTITLTNGEKASSAWKNVKMTDQIPEDLKLVDGSVYLNSQTADYSFEKGELKVDAGDIEAGTSKVISFKAVVLDTAYNKTIINEATGRGDNGTVKDDEYTARDEGVYINKGETQPYIEKKSSKGSAQVGDKIVYTITLGNREKAEYKVENAKLSDTIPTELDLIDGSVQIDEETGKYSFDEETKELKVHLGDIQPGKEHTVRFTVRVGDSAYGKTIHNTSVLTGDNITPVKGEDEIGVKVADGNTRPTLTKEADKKTVKVGDRVTYTITAGNDERASVAIKNAKIEDELPEGLSFSHGSVYADERKTDKYTFDEETGKLVVELGDIKPGKEVKVVFTVTVNEAAYGKTIKNTAILKGDNSDPTEAQDPGVTVEDGDADLTVEKTADKETVKVGERVTYTIALQNSKFATAPVKNAVVTDVLPTGMRFDTGSVQIDGKAIGNGNLSYSFDEGTNTLKVNAGDVAPGKKMNVTFTATATGEAYGKAVKNIATVTSDNEDPKQDDTSVQVEDGIADLTLMKSVDKTEAKVGDTITYTITAKNASGAEVDVRDSILTDIIPEEITFSGGIQVDGKGRIYSYDGETREVRIELGNIAPGQTKEIKISGIVNSSAYGKEFKNVAVMKSQNVPEVTAESENTIVDPGHADGRTSTKTVNKNKVKVGETLTYSITLSNSSAATADWENVKVTDPLPEGMTFAANVKENGTATNNYSYDSESRTLSLIPQPIAPGESVTFDFDVTIDEGMQGEILVNTAVLDDNGTEEPIPGPDVIVDPGFARPWVNKEASASQAKPGDVVTYTVEVGNDRSATAPFKRVYLRDLLPDGMKMLGSVFVNNEAQTWSRHNDSIEVQIGDVEPGQTVRVTYDVMIMDEAKVDLKNVATAKGDNGDASDSAVVSVQEDEGGETPFDPYDEGTPAGYIEKTGDKTSVSLNSGDGKTDRVTYTVNIGNDKGAKVDWENVVFSDLIYFTEAALIHDSIKVDGVYVKENQGWYAEPVGHSFNMCVDLGTIKPGEEHTIQYTVKTLGAASLYETYENYAWAKGKYKDPNTGETKPLELEDKFGVKVIGMKPQSDIHLQLFQGTQDTENGPVMFWPTIQGNHMAINTHDACRTIYRSMSEAYRNQLLEAKGGQAALDALPDEAQKLDREIQFFIALGAANAYEFNWKDPRNVKNVDYYEYTWTWASGTTTSIKSLPASRNFLGRILNAAGIDPAMKTGKAYSTTDKSILTSRLQWAEELCDIFDRDKNPDTNGLPLRQYTDVSGLSAKQMGIINEVSNWHTYTLDSDGEEHWIICNGDTL